MRDASARNPAGGEGERSGNRTGKSADRDKPRPDSWAQLSTLDRGDRFPVQAKLTVSRPDDPLEREADAIADQVMRMPVPGPAPPAISRAGSEFLERKCAACEEESAAPIMRKCEQCEEDVPIARKAGAGTDRSGSRLEGGMRGIRGRGSPLPGGTNDFFSSRLGHDFSGVRIHAGDDADSLSRSINARAFTFGNDIGFARGEFNPDSSSGARLLAHELVHVVQQQGSGERVFRKPSKIVRVDVYETNYSVKIRTADGKSYEYVLDPPSYRRPIPGRDGVPEYVSGTRIEASHRASATVDKGKKPDYDYHYELRGSDKLPSLDDYPAVTSYDLYFHLRGTGGGSAGGETGDDREKETADGDETDNGDETGNGDKGGGGDKDGESARRGGEEVEGNRDGQEEPTAGEDPGDGTAADSEEKPTAGSEFGWLGWIKLPEELYGPLDDLVKLLGDAEELKALRTTLEGLADLSAHVDTLKRISADPDILVQILLGVEPESMTPALDALESWVFRYTPATGRGKSPKRRKKGLAALAAKVVKLITVVRRTLLPFFRIRSGFVQIAGSVMSIPGVADLLGSARGADPAVLQARVTEFAGEVAGAIQSRMQMVRDAFEKPDEALSAEDLLKPEDVGAAIARFIPKFAAKHPFAKLVVEVLEVTGQLDDMGRSMGREMIPDESLDLVNDAIVGVISGLVGSNGGSAVAVLDETIGQILPEIEQIIDAALDQAFATLPAESGAGEEEESVEEAGGDVGVGEEDAIQRTAHPDHRRQTDRSALSHGLHGSRGKPIPGTVRTAMESSLGFDFSPVRIHSGDEASLATEAAGARAFTHGADIYLGDGENDLTSREGRRLLAHELVHTVQQSTGAGREVLYRAAKTPRQLADDYLAKLRAKVLKSTGSAFAASPAKTAVADKILDKLDTTIIGRSIDRKRVRDRLSGGYNFSPRPVATPVRTGKKAAKKVRVRVISRKAGMLMYLPPLKVDKSSRKVRLNLRRPYDPDRARLWRRLSCNVGGTPKARQAHHVIPLQIRAHPLVRTAEASGQWDFNDTDNGICLPISIHFGSHPLYTREAKRRLDDLFNKGITPTSPWPAIKPLFLNVVSGLKRDVAAGKIKMR